MTGNPIFHSEMMESTKEVMSLHPVMNSKYSQISEDTQDMLIECTSQVDEDTCRMARPCLILKAKVRRL